MNKDKIKNIILVMIVAVISSALTSFLTTNSLSTNKLLGSVSHSDYLDSSKVTYLDSNVQDSIDNLYTQANDFSTVNNKIDSYFQNNPTSYFDGRNLFMNGNGTGGDTGAYFMQNNAIRGSIGTYSNGDMFVSSYGSSSVEGQGTLYLLGNPVMINGRELAVHGCYSYTGITDSDSYLKVTHNLNISSYSPVVTTANEGNALVVFNVRFVTENSFYVGIASIDNFMPPHPFTNLTATIHWCY